MSTTNEPDRRPVLVFVDLPNMAPVEGRYIVDEPFLRGTLLGILREARKRGSVHNVLVFLDITHYRAILYPVRSELADLGFQFIDCPPIQKYEQRTEERVDRSLERMVRGFLALDIRPATFVIASADNGYAMLVSDLQNAGHYVISIPAPNLSYTRLGEGADEMVLHPMDPTHPLESIKLEEALEVFTAKHGNTLRPWCIPSRPMGAWTEDDLVRFKITILLSAFLNHPARSGSYTLAQLRKEMVQRLHTYGVYPTQAKPTDVEKMINYVIHAMEQVRVLHLAKNTGFSACEHPLHAYVQTHWAPVRQAIHENTLAVRKDAPVVISSEALEPWNTLRSFNKVQKPTVEDGDGDKINVTPTTPELELKSEPKLESTSDPVEIFIAHGRTLEDGKKRIGSKQDLLKVLRSLGLAQKMNDVASLIWLLSSAGAIWIETRRGKKTYHFLPNVELAEEEAS